MLTKAKSLYQVKLILDCLPYDEYKLIPQETIDYIKANMEYDKNIIINPDIPLEKQKIDDKTYEFLDKILKNLNKTSEKKKNNIETKEYIKKVKEDNEEFNAKIEIVMLKEIIESLKKENSKLPKAKALIEEYKDFIKKKDAEIIELKMNNKKLHDDIKKVPTIIRRIFIKDIN